jgi:hypothetical protein
MSEPGNIKNQNNNHLNLILLLGNINNYKGVMLCSRPNEGIQIIREKLKKYYP